jgi:polysaccharide chain length determinant protein (PEP-CTERM system associated)
MMPGRRYTPATIRWIIKKRLWLCVGPMVLFGLIAGAVSFSMKDRYRAQTMILVVPQRVPENYVRPAVAESIEQRIASITPQIMSETRLERIITELDLYPDVRRKKGGLQALVEDLRSDINVEIIRGDLFRVTYSGDNPYKVMQVTQRLASLFVEENLKDREQLAVGTNRFLESQLDNTRRQLEEQEHKVQTYRQTHAGELPTQIGATLQVLQTAAFQFQSGEEALARERDRRLELERTLAELTEGDAHARASAKTTEGSQAGTSPVPPVTDVTSDTPAPPAARDLGGKLAQLRQYQLQLAALELRLKPDHPDVISLKRRISDLEKSTGVASSSSSPDATSAEELPDSATIVRNARITQVRAQLINADREIARRTADQEKLKLQIVTLQQRVDAQPAREAELIALTRDYETLKGTYTTLLAKKEESGIAANLERQQVSQQFKTLDPARLPERPYGPPRTLINLVGMGAGLALGLGLTVLLELRDQSFRSAAEIVPVLSLPVLASVPSIVTASERRRARRMAFAVITLLVTSVGTAGVLAYKYGWVDLASYKFW